MKIAIFHNYLDNIGGAEMVTLTLARELGADIYTTNINQEMIAAMGFSDISIFSIGRVPKNVPWRQELSSWRFRWFSAPKKYDAYVIAGDWAVAGAMRNAPCLWYVHSPIREIWDSYAFVRNTLMPRYKRPMFDLWVHFNRARNRKYVSTVDRFVCNSRNTQGRLQAFLGKEAEVVHPPIDTNAYSYQPHRGYWLAVNRLINHKRIELQLEAFAKLPEEKLIIVGSYEKNAHFQSYVKRMQAITPKNVEIRHWVSQTELRDLYAHCKGFLTTAMDEDFGMTVVEAMAAGKPVVAPREGGYRETVIDGVTGVLVDDISADTLCAAMKRVGADPETYRAACEKHAQIFDTGEFIAKIKSELSRTITPDA